MSLNNGILLNAVLRPKLLNIAFASCSFIHFDFLLPHTAILMITLFYLFLVFTTLEFIFSAFFFFFFFFLHFKQYVNIFYFFIMVSTWKVWDYFWLTIQLAHLDFSLITLFVIITFFEPILSVFFYNWNNNFACFIMMEIFLLM